MRIGLIAGLIGLIALIFNFTASGHVQAAPGFQDTQGYEGYPTDPADPTDIGSGYSGYDASETATAPASGVTPSAPAAYSTPSAVFTQTQTPTNPPNTFQTEDSEMRNSLATPAVTDTPGPTATAYETPTVTRTPRQLTPTSKAAGKKSGEALDWGMFWMGFSIPVLGACGLVLYLLDRRPDLFKRRR